MLKNKAEQSGGEEVKAPPCETLLKKLSAKLQLHPKPKRAKLKPTLTCVSFCPKETNRKKGKEKKTHRICLEQHSGCCVSPARLSAPELPYRYKPVHVEMLCKFVFSIVEIFAAFLRLFVEFQSFQNQTQHQAQRI